MSDRTASQSPSKRTKHSSLTPTLLPLGDLDADLHGSHVRSILVSPASSFPPNGDINKLSTSTMATLTAQSEAQQYQQLQVKRLKSSAQLPTRGSAFAAGYDMYASEDKVVPARGMGMVSTGIAIAVPEGTYGRVAPRSGLAVKHSITTGAGVIDYDYRGEVKVVLFNLGDADFSVKAGDRIAQLVLERIVTPEVVEVGELVGTERGAGGFGSTGGFGGVQQVVVLGNCSAKRKGEDEAMDLGA